MDEKKKRLVFTVVAISFVLQAIVIAYLLYAWL